MLLAELIQRLLQPIKALSPSSDAAWRCLLLGNFSLQLEFASPLLSACKLEDNVLSDGRQPAGERLIAVILEAVD